MSKALRCDRCKTCFIPEECEGRMIKFRTPMIYTSKDVQNPLATCVSMDGKPYDETFDLCPHCAERFLMFMWRKDSQNQQTPL